MRTTILTLIVLSACASAPTSSPPIPESVREHLESPTRLLVAPDSSGGVLTARRWTRDGWVAGQVPLVIENGEVGAHVDHDGRLIVTELAIVLAPIEIPESVIGTGATLERLRLALTAPPNATATTTWSGEDDATAATSFDLTLAWAITVNDTTAALAPVRLPPIPGQILVGGDGERVDATVTLGAPGQLWSWAGLIELGELHLVLDTSTP